MLDFKSIRKWSSFLAVIFVLINQTHSVFHQFTCEKKEGSSVPSIPDTYSTNIRVNYPNEHRTAEVREVRNRKENKAALEFWAEKRHVKYILNGDQLLFINFNKSDERPSCEVRSKSSNAWLEDKDAGPRKIFQNMLNVLFDKSSYYVSDLTLDNGIFLAKFEACLSDPKLNISLGFTDPAWIPSHSSALNKDTTYPAIVEAEMDYVQMAALFSNFNPVMPDDNEFQPPEDVYCKGLKSDKKVPDFPKYFSFDAEIIKYAVSEGIVPVITHRSVYYDYPAGISRTDFYDPIAEDEDIFSPVRAEVKSIVHDFNSGVQYTFNSITGKCSLGKFKDNFAVISRKIGADNSMPTAKKYFGLEEAELVYNGQYSARGLISDVFTSSIAVPGKNDTKRPSTVSWYFSTDRAQVVGNENVEKNVLLRMVVRPQATTGKEDVVIMNFYNFAKEEPNTLKFDLTGCYNDSSRKNLVLTFPANDLLRGSEKLIRNHVHQAIKDATGISTQRIFVSKVSFSGQYMFAEFTIIANPPAMAKTSKPNESSLEEAFAKLRESVSKKTFKVRIPTKEKEVNLMPEPNGLNEFAGDRKKEQEPPQYKEGSVVALTIGMLVLGFILGGVTLNLAVSRKFGVSLFQKAKYGDSPFDNPLGESSM